MINTIYIITGILFPVKTIASKKKTDDIAKIIANKNLFSILNKLKIEKIPIIENVKIKPPAVNSSPKMPE